MARICSYGLMCRASTMSLECILYCHNIGFLGLWVDLWYCPHPATAYDRGNTKSYIYLYYKSYPIVAGWGQDLRWTLNPMAAGGRMEEDDSKPRLLPRRSTLISKWVWHGLRARDTGYLAVAGGQPV